MASSSSAPAPASSSCPNPMTGLYVTYGIKGKVHYADMARLLRFEFIEHLKRKYRCYIFSTLRYELRKTMEIKKGPWPGEVVWSFYEIMHTDDWKVHGPTDIPEATKLMWLRKCRIYHSALKAIDNVLDTDYGVWEPGVKKLLKEQKIWLRTQLDALSQVLFDFAFLDYKVLDNMVGEMTIPEDEARSELAEMQLQFWKPFEL